jgi:hypothetical protein
MSITIHIDRLILDGMSVPHRQRPQLQAALEAELARLLDSGGLSIDLSTSGTLPAINGGEIHVQDGENPAQLGRRIAQAVYRGIGQ